MKTGTNQMEDMIMKKSLVFIVAIIAVVACTRSQEINLHDDNITLIAKTEVPTATRTVVESETHVYWEPGDEIAVFSGRQSGKFITDLTVPSSTATFKGTLGDSAWEEGMELWAVYPYSKDLRFDGETIVMTLPSEQVAREGSFEKDVNLSLAHSNSSTLQFLNICGGIAFSVKQEGITSVTFTANGGEALAGIIKVGFDSNGQPVVEEVVAKEQSVVVKPSSGSFKTDGTLYYAILLPQTYTQGFSFSFDKSGIQGQYCRTKTTNLKRGVFGRVLDIDETVEFIDEESYDYGELLDYDLSGLVTVHNPTKGGLEDVLMGWGDYESIRSLKITGIMNDVDFLVIYRDMPNLRYLDISDIDNTTLPTKAFYNSTNVTHLVLPKALTEIDDQLFYGSALVAVMIMKNLKIIGTASFRACKSLRSVVFEGGSQLQTIGGGAFYDCSSLESIMIPASVETIGYTAFKNCIALTTVEFEKGSRLRIINGYVGNSSDQGYYGAFYGCTALTSIVIPASVEIIGGAAFWGCTSLSSVTFDAGSQLKTIEGGYYLTKGYYGAFYGCTALTSIVIPASVEEIGISAFQNCTSLVSVSFEQGSRLSEIQGNELGSSSSVGVFNNCTSLLAIEIPASVKTIGPGAFFRCKSLSSLTFEKESHLSTIGGHPYVGAFEECENLTSVTIPASVKVIEVSAFRKCKKLTSVLFEKGSLLTRIGCELPAQGYQGEGPFNETALTSICIPASVETIGDGAFSNCSSLSSVTFEKGSLLCAFGDMVFYSCTALKTITIPSGIEELSKGEFWGCSSLQIVSFEENSRLKAISYIQGSPFSKCSSLKTFDATNCSLLTTIDNQVFKDFSSLRLFYCGAETPPTVGKDTFSGIDPYAVLKVPDNCVDAYKSATYWSDFFPQISGFND